ncbi:proton pump-interactor 1-like protein [Carex littledalei]|uniref:Proton pump-interactor 1-like protein n=1 Tax=Carex littledalei TaxID=544730 RepID=A0A833VC40_9POAL|nr:proton pump-interactor 1-like protein [Carex littledalei]
MDIEITRKIEEANLEIKKKNEVIDDYSKDLKRYREDKKSAEWKLQNSKFRCRNLTWSIHQKRENLFYVKIALNKKSTGNRAVMQSPEVTEFSKHISGLKHRVQRGRITLKEEKQLIKQMKELKGEKNKVVTLVSDKQKKQDEVVKGNIDRLHYFMKTPMEEWPQSLTEEINNLKASKLDVTKKMKYFEQYLEDIDNQISYVIQKMDTAISERDRTNELRRKSKELADKLNACYYKNHGLLNSAKHLAITKDIAALAELSNSELEKFFSQWNEDKTFRSDYNRRVLWSLDIRGLSKDGRIRNPDEKFTIPESLIPWPTPVFK